MRISSGTTEYLEVTMSAEEAAKMEACDYETMNDFAANIIQKYNRWLADKKRIKTKEILQRANA